MRNIRFAKFHALENDFIVIKNETERVDKRKWGRIAESICNRRSGIGADGIVLISKHKSCDDRIDIFNADGGWAEKSGNGSRIAAYYLWNKRSQKTSYSFLTGKVIDTIQIGKKTSVGLLISAKLGAPSFETKMVPVKTRHKYLINSPITLGGKSFPLTCLSIGNPHVIMFVGDFDFDWQTLGSEIENHKMFPNRTNVEFVKIINRHKIQVAEWERGAGPTGSSGTGAAAAVSAGVMVGLLERTCEVLFESGSLMINYKKDDNIIELTGPVNFIGEGIFVIS